MDTIQILTPLARQGIERALAHRKECLERLERADTNLSEAIQDGWNVRRGTIVYRGDHAYVVHRVVYWSVPSPDWRPNIVAYRQDDQQQKLTSLGTDWRTSVEVD